MTMHRYIYADAGNRCHVEMYKDCPTDRGDLTCDVQMFQPKRDGLWQLLRTGLVDEEDIETYSFSLPSLVTTKATTSIYTAEWIRVVGGVRATINYTPQYGQRIGLVLRRDDQHRYFWQSESEEEEDCEIGGFASIEAADEAARLKWGAEVWGLRWCFENISSRAGVLEFDTGHSFMRAVVEGNAVRIYTEEGEGIFVFQGTIAKPAFLTPREIYDAAWMTRFNRVDDVIQKLRGLAKLQTPAVR